MTARTFTVFAPGKRYKLLSISLLHSASGNMAYVRLNRITFPCNAFPCHTAERLAIASPYTSPRRAVTEPTIMRRATLASLLKQLQLPDGDSGAKVGLGVRSVKARKTAQARWGK
jgi:hypothetical protein